MPERFRLSDKHLTPADEAVNRIARVVGEHNKVNRDQIIHVGQFRNDVDIIKNYDLEANAVLAALASEPTQYHAFEKSVHSALDSHPLFGTKDFTAVLLGHADKNYFLLGQHVHAVARSNSDVYLLMAIIEALNDNSQLAHSSLLNRLGAAITRKIGYPNRSYDFISVGVRSVRSLQEVSDMPKDSDFAQTILRDLPLSAFQFRRPPSRS